MKLAVKVASAPAKPLLIYDGDCGFCRFWVLRWERATGGRVDHVVSQDSTVAARFPEIPGGEFEKSVVFIETTGDIFTGAEAVFRSLGACWWGRLLASLYAASGLFARTAERAYSFVARNRGSFSRLNRFLWGSDPALPAYAAIRWLFLRLLGVIYLIAFLSLAGQVVGLVGGNGITPAADFMDRARTNCEQRGIGLERFHLLPTLCWFGASDGFLRFLCYSGGGLAVLLFLNIAPAICLFLLWVVYLSLSNVCGAFLRFQWDALLLETGFLAIFFAPLQWWPRFATMPEPSRAALLLLRTLLFLLMFESGVVKLASHDETWRSWTALNVHYETQPLPTWIGWYAHQLPPGFQKVCVAVMFGIELGVPCLIFAPRRLRFVAAALLLFLQVVIFLTGNYCFFNLLAMLLCLPLLDDAALAKLFPSRWRSRLKRCSASAADPSRWRWPRWVTVPFAIVFVIISADRFRGRLGREPDAGGFIQPITRWLAPFEVFNDYGLFAAMTTTRPEIVIEGSNDAEHWQPYGFKYKPGDPDRRPAFVAPHQPRIDWQMWFAALGDYQHNPWLVNLCVRLLQGSGPVLKLLGHNPFPEHPPKYIRASLYQYRFTNFAERRATGAWWKREYLGQYLPVISLPENKTAAD